MLEVENITKVLANGKQLLKGISFSVMPGEFIGIIGPSGAGKTLTLRCLNGLLKPTTGRVNITLPNKDKVDVSKISGKELRYVRRHIGLIFQGFNLVKRLTALENVMIGKLGQMNVFRSLFYGFTDQESELALEVLKKVKIEDLAYRRVSSMSGGEMQRVAIARAMNQNPVIMIADEPIANLDPSNARGIMKLLKLLSIEVPVIGVFHQPDMLVNFCTRVIAIKDGKVFYDGEAKLSTQLLHEIYEGEYEEIIAHKVEQIDEPVDDLSDSKLNINNFNNLINVF